MIEIAPSILAADFTKLGQQVCDALAAGAPRIHCDVMDGRFVPAITFGPMVIEAIAPEVKAAGALLEAHLMIVEPERQIDDTARAGADVIVVHAEVCPHLNRVVHQVRALGRRPGVAINPATPLVMLDEILPDLDHVIVMTVNPGLGGQALIPSTLGKVTRLRETLSARGLTHIDIEVDGGIHAQTISAAAAAGATVAVAGSGVFNAQHSVAENLRLLRAACNQA
jgi:ribulose-phosphate 3-epimerase